MTKSTSESLIRALVFVAMAAAVSAAWAAGPSSAPATAGAVNTSNSNIKNLAAAKTGGEPAMIATKSGLKYADLELGTGTVVKSGMLVLVDYEGWLPGGEKFDSSYDRREPFRFKVGAGDVILGWEEGVVGMKVGGKRKLVVPADLAYGEAGAPPRIPANATLTFEVRLLAAK